MRPIEQIIKFFTSKFEILTLEEDHEMLIYKIRSELLNIPEQDEFIRACKNIPERDHLILMVIIDDDNDAPISYNTQRPSELNQFLSGLSDAKDIFDDETVVEIKVELSKKRIDNILSIYFFDGIIATWNKYSIKSFWHCFGRILRDNFINFEVMEEIKPFHTANISFSTINTTYHYRIDSSSCTDRIPFNEKMTENCHFANSSECKLIPNDFHLLEQSEKPDLNELFFQFSLIQSLVFLFDITSREQDKELFYKIRGYRQISGVIYLDGLKTNSSIEYFKIFSWVYNGGNLSDKIGLARNILTIHFKENDPVFLADDVLSSIKSGYDIYLKQNIDQYISAKRQVAENIQNINTRANQIVESITVPFRNSFLGIITFFASMCIIRISLTQSLNRIFTEELAILSFFLIGLSLFYLRLLHREVEIDKTRFSRNYENLKTRYEDIFDPNDIKNIFNHDKDFKENVDYIDDKKKRYCRAWKVSHAFLAFVVVVLLFVGGRHIEKQDVQTNKAQLVGKNSIVESPVQETEKKVLALDQSGSPPSLKKNLPPKKGASDPIAQSELQIILINNINSTFFDEGHLERQDVQEIVDEDLIPEQKSETESSADHIKEEDAPPQVQP